MFVAMAARLGEAAPISPSFLAETPFGSDRGTSDGDPFVADRTTAALPFGAVPVLPMTCDGDPFVADRATAALPFGADFLVADSVRWSAVWWRSPRSVCRCCGTRTLVRAWA